MCLELCWSLGAGKWILLEDAGLAWGEGGRRLCCPPCGPWSCVWGGSRSVSVSSCGTFVFGSTEHLYIFSIKFALSQLNPKVFFSGQEIIKRGGKRVNRQGPLGCAGGEDKPRRGPRLLTVSLLALFFRVSPSSEDGFCLAETGFLCLSSEKTAKWCARCYQLGKKSDCWMFQRYLQCHWKVDEEVYIADKKGCWEMVASTNKRTGLKNFRNWCEYSERFWEGTEEGLRTWT